MDIDLKKLNHLVTVARLGSFSRAADELHITQPALSRSIASLEDMLGVRIFDRSRSGAALTAAGQLAIEEAEMLLRRARTFSHNLRQYGSGNAGKIAFGMGPMVASMTLPSLSSHFMSQASQLYIRTAVKQAAELIEDLKNDRIEMLFCGLGQMAESPDLSISIIGQVPLAMLARSTHPLFQLAEITQADIFEYPLLSAVELSANVPTRVGGAFICDNYDVLRTTVLNCDSIWMSSPLLVKEEMEKGLIRAIFATDFERPPHADICMAHLQGKQISATAMTIVDYVRAFFVAQT